MGTMCTVKDERGENVFISSQAEVPHVPKTMPDFWGVLKKWECTWVWDNLQWIGEDDWLTMAIAEGMCIAVMDGSYMRDLY